MRFVAPGSDLGDGMDGDTGNGTGSGGDAAGSGMDDEASPDDDSHRQRRARNKVRFRITQKLTEMLDIPDQFPTSEEISRVRKLADLAEGSYQNIGSYDTAKKLFELLCEEFPKRRDAEKYVLWLQKLHKSMPLQPPEDGAGS